MGNLSSLDGFGRRAGNAASTATATATAAPGVVLCVADGIVWIVVHVVAGEDLGGRLRRGIDRLIGVAAGEDKRCDHDRDAEPCIGRFPSPLEPAGGTFVWSMRRRSRPSRAPSPGVAISLNSARLTLIRCAARNGRGYRLICGEVDGASRGEQGYRLRAGHHPQQVTARTGVTRARGPYPTWRSVLSAHDSCMLSVRGRN